MPSQNLPALRPPIDQRLNPAPVRQAICQVKHEDLALDPYAYGASVQAELHYEDMQPHSTQEFLLLPAEGGLRPTTTEQRGILLRSPGWSVSIFPNAFTLDCTSYERWEQFRERFEALLDAVIRHGSPRLVSRVGVRFVDELVSPTNGGIDMLDRIEPNVVGIVRHPRLGPRITAATSMVQLQEDRYRVLLRHGFDPAADPRYMVDTDCYLETGFAMEREVMIAHADALHTLSSRVFRECMSDEYFAAIGGEPGEV